MATTQTVNLPGQRRGPNGGDAYRFDFLANDGVTAADRSVATRCNVTELLSGAQVGPIVTIECVRLGLEVALSVKGLSAQRSAAVLANTVN